MDLDTYKKLVAALDEWIALLKHPACQNHDWVATLEGRRSRLLEDPYRLRNLLVDGNIWGGMGSLIDSAGVNYSFFRPATEDSEPSLKEWQAAHVKIDAWTRSFNTATIQLGTALIAACTEDSYLTRNEKSMIEGWVRFARMANKRPYEPLTKEQVCTIEHNIQFEEPFGG